MNHSYPLLWNAKWSSYLKYTCLNCNSDNNRVLTVEYGSFHYLKKAWENSFRPFIRLSFFSALLNVNLEFIKQVVDDVSGEDLNSILISKLLGFRSDSHIKSQDSCVLLLSVISSYRFHCFKSVFLVDRSDVNRGYRDLHSLQELKQGF